MICLCLSRRSDFIYTHSNSRWPVRAFRRDIPRLENIFSVNSPEWLLAETHIYYKHTLTHRLRYCNLGRFHTGERWFQLFFASFTPTVVFLPSFSSAPDLSSYSTAVYVHLFPPTCSYCFFLPARIEELPKSLEHGFSRLAKFKIFLNYTFSNF